MSYIIALAGKGGTGKTTVAALIVKFLTGRGTGSVLAVDADPNSNLAEALGLTVTESIGTVLDMIAASADRVPAGMTKERFIEYKVQTTIAEGNGFDVLTMGKPEGPGCYCYVNNVLRGVVTRLIDDYQYVIIDNEAGLEHLSRRTTRKADLLLVVANNTASSLRAAARIGALADALKIDIASRYLLVNRLKGELAREDVAAAGIPFLGTLPEDEQIEQASRQVVSLAGVAAGSPGRSALDALLQKLI